MVRRADSPQEARTGEARTGCGQAADDWCETDALAGATADVRAAESTQQVER